MGLGLLPWERLHPYVLGPLLCALNLWFFFSDNAHPFSTWIWEVGGFAFGVGLIWFKYRKDSTPQEERDKNHTHKDIRLDDK